METLFLRLLEKLYKCAVTVLNSCVYSYCEYDGVNLRICVYLCLLAMLSVSAIDSKLMPVFVCTNVCLFHFSFLNTRRSQMCIISWNQSSHDSHEDDDDENDILVHNWLVLILWVFCTPWIKHFVFEREDRRHVAAAAAGFFKTEVSAIQTNHFNCNRSLSAVAGCFFFLTTILHVERVELICMSPNGNVRWRFAMRLYNLFIVQCM